MEAFLSFFVSFSLSGSLRPVLLLTVNFTVSSRYAPFQLFRLWYEQHGVNVTVCADQPRARSADATMDSNPGSEGLYRGTLPGPFQAPPCTGPAALPLNSQLRGSLFPLRPPVPLLDSRRSRSNTPTPSCGSRGVRTSFRFLCCHSFLFCCVCLGVIGYSTMSHCIGNSMPQTP